MEAIIAVRYFRTLIAIPGTIRALRSHIAGRVGGLQIIGPGHAIAASLCAASLLSGCGGDGVDQQADPLAAYKSQQIAWAPCNAEQTHGIPALTVSALGADLSCAQVKVPMDYAHPSSGDISIGAILFNPGGPGGDGYQFGALKASLARLVNPASGGYRGLYDMSRKFDFVGFSPRGVGRSTQLSCSLSAPLVHVDWLPTNLSQQNVDRALHNDKLYADACRNVPLAPFINTDSTARDMDVLRAALGDAKLNYIGYSYGTLLGAWYASLFPQQTGRILLDSSVDYDMPLPLQSQAVAQQTLYDDTISLYALTKVSQVALPNTLAGIRTLFTDAPDWSRDYLAARLYSVMPYHDAIDDTIIVMAAAYAITQASALHPTPEAYATALSSHIYFPNDPESNEEAQQVALGSITDYSEAVTGVYAPPQAPTDWVNPTVRCSDAPVSSNPAYWVSRASVIAREAPIAHSSDIDNPCIYWGPVTVTRPALSVAAKSAPPVLMLQSENDMLTPLAGAQTTLSALPSASMILVNGEYSHGLFPYGTACVDSNVAHYFLTGAMPPRNTVCAGYVLPGVVANASAASIKRAFGDSFTDPEQAQDIIERTRELLRTHG
ncbi:MAG: secreted peptidase [uncultured Paraburkholderia sp.]|uniref:alpha/beta fold hydrolase n=1 Tax=uncultured Paraburkholderia sp. TaxID=1822466 RepID=UPI0025919C56|nr:alpha/beta fold hydrolase [uncultured Paraburkholderia sp.]CAH2897389.1 MAG: secreted peptidase [uncultured Paraburkholderia sp.]CAH2923714.1 MAG: secreted peptidase [uncultured Paraburkholderia sp.]